jgi:hypothetical protein
MKGPFESTSGGYGKSGLSFIWRFLTDLAIPLELVLRREEF